MQKPDFLPKENFLNHKVFEYVDIIVDSTISCQHENKEIIPQPSSSPHTAGEFCKDCGKWLRWVGKKEYSRINHNTDSTCLNGGVA